MNSTIVRTNIAIQGGFFPRSLKSCRMEVFWSGAGRMRSWVVASVTKKITASATGPHGRLVAVGVVPAEELHHGSASPWTMSWALIANTKRY